MSKPMQPTSPTEPGTPERDALRKKADNIVWGGMNKERQVTAIVELAETYADRAALVQSLQERLPDREPEVGHDSASQNRYDGFNYCLDQVQQLLAAEDEGKNVSI